MNKTPRSIIIENMRKNGYGVEQAANLLNRATQLEGETEVALGMAFALLSNERAAEAFTEQDRVETLASSLMKASFELAEAFFTEMERRNE